LVGCANMAFLCCERRGGREGGREGRRGGFICGTCLLSYKKKWGKRIRRTKGRREPS